MASMRSKLMAAVMRRTLKKSLGKSGSIIQERASLEKMSGLTSRRKVGEKAVVGGVPGEWQAPKVAVGGRVLLYLHGGGYALGSPTSHRDMAGMIGDACGARTLILDYRLGPETPFPGAVEDAVAAYQALLAAGTPADRLFIAGDSAGGGLTAATLVSLRDQGLPLPAAGICISPWTDMSLASPSMYAKAEADPLLRPEALKWLGDQYLAGQDPKAPLASPVYADLSGLPPLLIHVGSEEVLLDDALRLHEAARAAGVKSTLEVWDGMMHVWHLMAAIVPEGKQAIQRIGQFVGEHSAV